MKILFTICGRAGSKGLKNKNIKQFLGFPLPFYTISVIQLYISSNPEHEYDIVLNTDSNDLIKLFHDNLNIKFDVIDRKINLAQDNTPKVAVVWNCLEVMESRTNKKYDIIVDLDITSPIRTVDDLANLISKKSSCNSDVVFSVTDSRRNPYFNMVMKVNNKYTRVIESSFNSRQEAPEIFDMNASLYAYSPSFLESGKGIFEGNCDIIKMIDSAVLDIDHENDFELMQVIAEYIYKKYPKYGQIRDNISNCLIRFNKEIDT